MRGAEGRSEPHSRPHGRGNAAAFGRPSWPRASTSLRPRSAIWATSRLRAIAVLARADAVLCEDTRHSRTLLSHFGIGTPARPYHEHNAAKERPRVLADLAAGQRIALISDAGTPLVSDPGWKLVREAIDAGPSRRGAAGRFGDADCAGRRRPADRCVPVRRVPAAQECRPAHAHRRAVRPCRRRWCSSRRPRASPRRLPISPPCSVRAPPRWRAS